MRPPRRTFALCFGCCLLVTLHGPSLADEEGFWGPTPSQQPGKDPPVDEPLSYWWTPSLPKLPSFHIPFGPWGGILPMGAEEGKFTTDAVGLTEPTDRFPERSGSGEGSSTAGAEANGRATRVSFSGVTAIRTDSHPEETTHSPHGSNMQRSKDDFDSSTLTTSTEDTLFSNTPTSTNTPTARSLPPQGTAATAEHHSRGSTAQHLPNKYADNGEVADFPKELLTVSSITPSETIAPTAVLLTSLKTTTINSKLVEATSARHPLGSNSPPTSPGTIMTPKGTTASISLGVDAATMINIHPSLTQADSKAKSGPMVEQPGIITSAMETSSQAVSITTTTFNILEETQGEDDEGEEDVDPLVPDWDLITSDTLPTTPASLTALQETLFTEDWSNPIETDMTLLPDCNKERDGICNLSYNWESTPPSDISPSDISPSQNATPTNQSHPPFLILVPPILVPLYTDWNSAMAAWGVAWEVHVYCIGGVFATVTLASALNLLCLPLKCPSGCGYFALVSLFLLAAGSTRAFSLLYDAYDHQDRLRSTESSLLLYEAPFPCLTAAFGLVFLLLSMRSRMQLSYSAFQRPCFLACVVALHFAAAFVPVTLLKFYQHKPALCLVLSVISRGAFVALATFLSAAYFVFYIYVRADAKHIYHLNNTSPTPAERYNRCPFAESRDWDRAAVTVCLAAVFSLACSGLQLYAMLNAMGITGGEEIFRPWPWWAFQFGCRVCELGVCLTLALVVAQPVYCSDHLPAAGSCWTELLAAKSPILPGRYQWTLSQQEKLAIVDTVGLGETESLPLYTLVDERLGNSLNGLDLLYHSNRALVFRDFELDMDLPGSKKPDQGEGGAISGRSSYTSDSTTDLRPPSPINLRRSIDEALFSESLFPMSLFSPCRPIGCSDLSLNNHSALPNGGQEALSVDPGLYRTSSCVEMASHQRSQTRGNAVLGAPPSPSLSSSTTCSSPERWRGSCSSYSLYRPSLGGSSMVLCPSPDRHMEQPSQEGHSGHVSRPTDPQRQYHTLGSASQESLDLDASEADRSVQEEFISVCRQIDALSICSETIDL